MIDLQAFVNRFSGKYWTFDRAYPNQCTAIVKQWAAENGWPNPNGGGKNALGFANFRQGYEWTTNSRWAVPSAGDIVVVNTGKYGHVAIAMPSNPTHLLTFAQNWPKGAPCKLVNHWFYRGVVGWLHKV